MDARRTVGGSPPRNGTGRDSPARLPRPPPRSRPETGRITFLNPPRVLLLGLAFGCASLPVVRSAASRSAFATNVVAARRAGDVAHARATSTLFVYDGFMYAFRDFAYIRELMEVVGTRFCRGWRGRQGGPEDVPWARCGSVRWDQRVASGGAATRVRCVALGRRVRRARVAVRGGGGRRRRG